MLTISVRLDEKRSTKSQYENRTAGVVIEASGLEMRSPEDILAKADELWALAQESVSRQFGNGEVPEGAPEGNGHQGNGNGRPPETGQAPSFTDSPSENGHSNGNGRKSYGRPKDPPTLKQKNLLRGIAKKRNLGPETIRDICQRVVQKDPRDFSKVDMMKLLDHLLKQGAAA